MDAAQIIIDCLIGITCLVFGFLLRALWQGITDLQTADKEIITRINQVEVLVVGNYVKESEFGEFRDAVFKKLDRIEDKIDKKADKEAC